MRLSPVLNKTWSVLALAAAVTACDGAEIDGELVGVDGDPNEDAVAGEHEGHDEAENLAFNPGLIPAGAPGTFSSLIRWTSEKPGPSDGTGAFRTVCAYSHMNTDDPLVYPGQPGKAHLHAYFGNKLTNAASTSTSLRTTGASTCRGGIANRSAYWVPAVIDTATGAPIKPASSNFYYKTGYNGIAPSAIKPFPQGLKILAGDPANKSANQPHAYWGCHEQYIGKLATIPNVCGAGKHIVMAIAFPQCWNGKDLDSADHRSHMAYPVNGSCPATHPVPIPEITYNILYKVPAAGTKTWRLSSDMYDAALPGGASIHADYMEAWQPDIVKTFVTNCDNKAVDCRSHLLGDGREIYDP